MREDMLSHATVRGRGGLQRRNGRPKSLLQERHCRCLQCRLLQRRFLHLFLQRCFLHLHHRRLQLTRENLRGALVEKERAGVVLTLQLHVMCLFRTHEQHRVPLRGYFFRFAGDRVHLHRRHNTLHVTRVREKHRIVTAHRTRRVGHHLLRRLLSPLLRQRVSLAETLMVNPPHNTHLHGTGRARRRGGRAHHRSQLHDALGVVRGAGLRHQQTRCLPASNMRGTDLPTPRQEVLLALDLVHCAESRQHTHHVPVHCRLRLVEGDGENGAGRVVPDPRHFQQLLFGRGDFAVTVLNNILSMSREIDDHFGPL